MRLYHYACEHSAAQIIESGLIIPQQLAALPGHAWYTDLETPIRDALGLTSNFSACNKIEYQFMVDAQPHQVGHWPEYARQMNINRAYRDALELTPGAMPMHWWVTILALPIKEYRKR